MNQNFKLLDRDWTAQSQNLKTTMQDLSKVRGECGNLEIELTTEQAKVKVKDFIIEGVQRDLKAVNENFDLVLGE